MSDAYTENLPWRVEVYGSTTAIEGRYYTVASDVTNHEAPLIASAPEMLAALKAAHRYLYLQAPPTQEWLNSIDALIAKAEGRT